MAKHEIATPECCEDRSFDSILKSLYIAALCESASREGMLIFVLLTKSLSKLLIVVLTANAWNVDLSHCHYL